MINEPAPASPDAAVAIPASAIISSGPKPLALVFTGSAREYFRIWIVNICLTLLTFGIFSAWAKVRKKRYFYSNTHLDGTPFQYLGQPIPILKGRLIATALLAAWYVATHYVLILIPVVLVLAAILAPWVAVRSAAFNARYSAYRNMTFHFSGSYWKAAKVIYGWLLLTIITFGFCFSWWQQRIKRFMVTHLGFGGVQGSFSADGGNYFKIYFFSGMLFGLAIAAMIAMTGIFFAAGDKAAGSPSMHKLLPVLIVTYGGYAAMIAYMHSRITNLAWNSTRLGSVQFRSSLSARGILWIYVSNTLAILASVGLLVPWASVRLARYRLERFSVSIEGDLQEFKGGSVSAVQAAGAEVGDLFDFDMSI